MNAKKFRVTQLVIAISVVVFIGSVAIQKMNAFYALRHYQVETAKFICAKWAADLDSQTTAAGVYKRPGDGSKHILTEKDPWENNLVALYSRGGAVETIEVRSWGPDGIEYSDDDLTATRRSANLAGVGAGIRDGVGEAAESGSKGAVRGAIDALKEQGLLGKKNDEGDDE